jgi:cephalosporin-C deacetylase-like acetyl esterase
MLAQQDNSARQRLIESLDALAETQLQQRAQAVAKIQTRAEMEKRKDAVRRKILGLIGGLPERQKGVAAKRFGTLTGDGFQVERLAYESLPGLWVTANLYVPTNGNGPFAAVLLAPGHEAAGKQSQYSWGVNFARNQVMALAIDPLGQGERLQYFDPERKASTIGGSTGEHGEANVPAILIGENIARYFINDSMRAIDYLITRSDVDRNRIGALGCSGGGTSTAYLAALDNRVKVAGVACYVTSFQELLPSATGVQEAEQSIPHFIEQGLDFGDWVELFAPKPYAIISTTNDMFPFEGARQTVEEAKRIYGIYDSTDKLQWITGPGGHGNLVPISPAILGFFLHHLNGAPAGEAAFKPERPMRPQDLLVTPTGQVSTSISGETIFSIVRAHAREMRPVKAVSPEDIRALTAAAAIPASNPPFVRSVSTEERNGYSVETIFLRSEDTDLYGVIAVPVGNTPKKAILLLTKNAGDDLDRLAKSGNVAIAFEPRPSPAGAEGLRSPYLGSFNLLSLRAELTGKTIMGLRIDDTIRAIDWLVSRRDIDKTSITVYGNGALGMVALHAAALDSRIRSVVVENTLANYSLAIDQPLHRNISEIMIPGVLRKYDVGELLMAIAPRPVTVINPQDATGSIISNEEFRKILSHAFKGQNIHVNARAADEPLGLP